jgi:RimJ/RimL family protein N-acetyltransferase
MKPFLETSRMFFFNFEQEDISLIRDLDSDPEVVRYISDGVPSDDTEVNRAMGIFLSYNKNYDQELGFWKVINNETNEFMGWFHFRPLKSDLNDLKNIELGYRLKKKFWGQGFATGCSQALIDQALKNQKIVKIWAHAMFGNKGSINVMKKVGLTLDYNDIYDQWPGEDKRCVWYSMKTGNKN